MTIKFGRLRTWSLWWNLSESGGNHQDQVEGGLPLTELLMLYLIAVFITQAFLMIHLGAL